MKTLKSTFIAGLMAFATAPVAQALELEVAPLALQARAEVMGFEASVDGQRMIVLTGETARRVAELAGVAFDASVQMIIATGNEIDELLENPIGKVDSAVEYVIVTTDELSRETAKLVMDSLRYGRATVEAAPGLISETVELALELLSEAAKNPVQFVDNAGARVIKTGKFLVGTTIDTTCGALRFVGIDLNC